MSIRRDAETRLDFPWLAGPGVAYLDTAATSQKPQVVIDAIAQCYATGYAPVYRGLYEPAEQATAQYEAVRAQAAEFIGAQHSKEIVFTKNATEGINLVARGWGQSLMPGDELVLTELEHHANIVPWLQLAAERNLIVRWLPVYDDATLNLEQLETIINQKTKLVAFTLSSNVVGVTDSKAVAAIIDRARTVGAAVLVDGAQVVAHRKLDVAALDVDFLVFSAHKMYGPAGVGILYSNERRHEAFKPVFGGGGMAYGVSKQAFSWRPFPHCLEVGTVDLAGVVGLGAAITYLQGLDREVIAAREQRLIQEAAQFLRTLPQVKVLGFPENGGGSTSGSSLISFVVEGFHPHDVAAAASEEKIYLRAGNHCCQPLHERLGVAGSVRISVGLYNDSNDIAHVVDFLTRLTKHPIL